ncbi:hypothetical protein [Mediterraneibacter gnavus]|uniref:hypothetical protein n=2 Tax=Mediterraneibacter gnavus TaxID=33038 RepID=UPI0036D3789E
MEFKKMKLRSNQEYDGVVRDVRVNEKKGTMWIFVELDEVKNQNFMKSFPLVLTEGSILWDFLNENELLDRKGKLDTDLLIDREVVVTLSKGKDSNWYIDEMHFYIETEVDDWGDDFDDDEDIDFGD